MRHRNGFSNTLDRGRITRLLILASLVVLALIVPFSGSARAQAPQAATFTTGQLLRVNFTVPFAWLRKDPTSSAAVVDTAQRGEFVIVASNTPSFDGVQWWWLVARAAGNVNGWIEQNSIEAAVISATNTPLPVQTLPPGTVAPWTADTVLVAAPGVPFIWVRTEPRPDSPIRLTIFPGTRVSPQPGVAIAVDQYNQIWWLMRIPALNRLGWIEQSSLMIAPPTATPTATQPPAATSTPRATPAQAPASLTVGQQLSLAAGVPFLYLRTTGSSYAPIVSTARPGTVLIVAGGPTWDDVQYWWKVQLLTGQVGWVEQAYIVPGPPPTSAATATPVATLPPAASPTPNVPAASWRVPNVLSIKPNVSSIWLRTNPSSLAGPNSIERGGLFVINGGPSWDGVQWWWKVQSGSTGATGWVEQNSLMLATSSSDASASMTAPAPAPVTATPTPAPSG